VLLSKGIIRSPLPCSDWLDGIFTNNAKSGNSNCDGEHRKYGKKESEVESIFYFNIGAGQGSQEGNVIYCQGRYYNERRDIMRPNHVCKYPEIPIKPNVERPIHHKQ
jgi:hypothetical protein